MIIFDGVINNQEKSFLGNWDLFGLSTVRPFHLDNWVAHLKKMFATKLAFADIDIVACLQLFENCDVLLFLRWNKKMFLLETESSLNIVRKLAFLE